MEKAGNENPGGMAAIIGLDSNKVEALCKEASTQNEIVQIANDNCPGQIVISGEKNALKRAIKLAKDSGAKLVKELTVSIAAHSPLMLKAQESFGKILKHTKIQDPSPPLIGNVSASPLDTAEQIFEDLQAQLTSRVRWTESIQFMIANGVNFFYEIGSGKVLTGLLKRIDRNVRPAKRKPVTEKKSSYRSLNPVRTKRSSSTRSRTWTKPTSRTRSVRSTPRPVSPVRSAPSRPTKVRKR